MTTTVLNTKMEKLRIPDSCDFVTTTILNIKIGEVENKIPDVSGLVTTAVLNTKIGEVENKIPDHAKSIATIESDKFASTIFDKNKNKLSNK